MKVDMSGIALAVMAVGFLVFLFLGRKKPDTIIPTPSPDPTPTSNLAPEVFPPFLAGEIDFGGQFIIDLRHRLHGCDGGGAPTDVSGARDPDGDLLRYRVNVRGPDKDGKEIDYTVFTREGVPINDVWTPTDLFPVVKKNHFDAMDTEMEQEAVLYCYAGRNEDTPPGGGIIAMGCNPPIHDPDEKPTLLGKMTVMYEARDPQGRSRSAAIVVPITITSC